MHLPRALRATAFLEEAGESIEGHSTDWMHPFTELRHKKCHARNRWLAFTEHHVVDTITKMTELTSYSLSLL